MVARRPRGPLRDRPRGNRAYAVIFLVTAVLIVSLYVWNKQKIDAANREEMGRDRLCEVRAEMGLDPAECEEEQVP